LDVPFQNGTNLIYVSESDGSPGADPYGHIHGRVYSVTKAGYYRATWQFVDTSTNGAGGGPVDMPSAPFATQFQAGLTIDSITIGTNGASILIAAPSFHSDNAGAGTQPAQYTLEGSATLGRDASWKPVADPIAGDNRMHSIDVPLTTPMRYFRLSATYPALQ
jgi:hypothetical protein